MTLTILGLDPGNTSGVVVLAVYGGADYSPPSEEVDYSILEHAQVGIRELPRFLEYRVTQVDMVAAEAYTITSRTATLTRQNAALYAIGGALFLCDLNEVMFKLQIPADAKTAFPDPVLREMGLFNKVTGDHARDALRHALLAARRFRSGVYRPVEATIGEALDPDPDLD